MNAMSLQHLPEEHREADELFLRHQEALLARDFAAAEALLQEVIGRVRRHIEVEEEALFPVLDACAGIPSGATSVMRMEHAEIRRLMAEVTESLERAGGERFVMSLAALTARIYAHNGKEERILYPAADRSPAGRGLREEVARRLRPT